MNTKNTLITLGGLCLIGMVAFVFCPSQSKAGSAKYKVEPSISIEPYKSDAVRVSESYERMMGSYINTMDNRLGTADRGFDKVSAKLDGMSTRLNTMDKGLDKVSTKLDTMENRLGMTDRGFDKVTTKLDTIEKKIDDLAIRLTAIENALNITQQIPKPK
ncbi:MAG: hypothetical protein K9M75_00935 [Phycisphaerae bacterium]|nr:hypothetical protein [Phycisphaerae bacterium]